MNSYAFIVIPLAGTCYYMIYKGIIFFERTTIKEFTLMIFRVQLNCWRVHDFSENFQLHTLFRSEQYMMFSSDFFLLL